MALISRWTASAGVELAPAEVEPVVLARDDVG
jgi:hypothetical protein